MKLKPAHIKYLLHAVVIIGLIVMAVKYLDSEEIFQALGNFDYQYIPFILLLTVGYLLLKAWRFVWLLAPLSNDPPGMAIFKAYVSGQAATVVPGGIAARAGLLKQIDVPLGQATTAVLFNSGLDQGVLISGALVTSLWFERGRLPVLILIGIVSLFGLLFAVSTTRAWILATGHRLAKKFNFHEQWHGFLEAVPHVITPRNLTITVALTLAAFACHIIALRLTLAGLALSLPLTTLTLVYVLPTVLGRLSGLPGGFGVTEAGMVGFITSISPDISPGVAIAVVTIFRIATIVIPVVIGALVYFISWNGEKEVAFR